MLRRLGRCVAIPAVAALTALLASCIELTVDPKEIAAIEFIAPANPSFVVGDSLRDTLGAVTSLQAKVFDAGGDLVPNAPLYFVTVDSLSRIAGNSLLVANKKLVGTTKVYAVSGRLQSAARSLAIIASPDSIAFTPATVDTIKLKIPSSGSTLDTSTTVKVTVRAAGGVASTVRVRFELERRGTLLGPADTATYALVNTGLMHSRIDTTDASGTASRTLRVRVTAGTPVLDTLVVRATATMGGVLQHKPALKTFLIVPAP
ncbi:MAG: hypothetical protein IT359_12575 [Gemmatimonadaceae bacterium]|nr:hypothetical protein [Gemmatimonadaceae bacterium]